MKDQLSALIDGEFDMASAEHLITSAKSGGELKQCWAHYHLIGDVMRGESHMHQDFSARLMSQLESEPIIFTQNVPQGKLDGILFIIMVPAIKRSTEPTMPPIATKKI